MNLVWDFSKPFFDRGGQTILELCDRIVRDFQPERIILFGAYTYGNATPDSEMNFNHPHA